MKSIPAIVILIFTLVSLTPWTPVQAQSQVESAQSRQQEVYIGLLVDSGPVTTDPQSSLAQLQEEIHRVLGAERSVHFLPEHLRVTLGQADRVLAEYASLSGDPSVDLIIAVGAVSASTLAAQGALPKPTIAMGIMDTDLQEMPLVEPGVSGVSNYTYILSAGSIQDDLAAFHHIHPFARLAVIVSENLKDALDFQSFFDRLAAPFGARVELVFWGTEAPFPVVSDAADAVYLTMTFERQPQEILPLVSALAERKLPSFARGRHYVDAGMMACIGYSNGLDQIIRKLALTVEGIVLGEDLSAMPVRLNFDEQLVLNATAVERTGINLSFETLFSARILETEESTADRLLSLHEVIMEGLRNNIELRIEQQNVDLAGEDVRLARSSLLPKLDVSTTLLQVDPDAAELARGTQPERSGSGAGSIQQILFSEPAFANVTIQRYLEEAARHRTDLVALDVVLNLSRAYFDILLAKTARRIQRENLEVSRRNLEIARTRNAVGYAGVADVYRWESEVAQATQASIEAFNNLYLAKVQLNRLLNRPDIDEDFDVAEIELGDQMFGRFDPTRIGRLIDNAHDLRILTEFLVEESLKNMPSVKQLEANIRAAERQQKLNRRMFYLPSVALRGQADYTYFRGGKGVQPGPSTLPGVTWNLSVHLSYPLFQGNQRRIAMDQTAVQQYQLRLREEDLRNRLSEAVRVRVTNAVSKRTNIRFARVAAESAEKNFELVQDAYLKGQLAITQLIDAQRAAFSAREAETAAVYEYLVSYLALENSIGAYTMLMTSEELGAFVDRLTTFFDRRSETP
ncbi:MAG: TolC family protein [Gemmatimonadetes bacterium]|nr:TolC family protein [Gemmatimonadota bacterium]